MQNLNAVIKSSSQIYCCHGRVVLNFGNSLGVCHPSPVSNQPRERARKRISAKPENRCVVVTEAGSYLRLIDFVSLNLRLKDLLGPVTRVKKRRVKKKANRLLDVRSYPFVIRCVDSSLFALHSTRVLVLAAGNQTLNSCFGFGGNQTLNSCFVFYTQLVFWFWRQVERLHQQPFAFQTPKPYTLIIRVRAYD